MTDGLPVVGVVDDRPEVGRHIGLVLLDFTVVQVLTVAEAPDLLSRRPVTILVDGCIPDDPADGSEAVRLLRDAGYTGPMLAISSNLLVGRATADADPLGRTDRFDKTRIAELEAHISRLRDQLEVH